MKPHDFSVFRILISNVYEKAFGEPINRLPHSKALALGMLIEEMTGVALSYKSLANYVNAVLEEHPEKINPSLSTLATLAQYVTEEKPGRQWITMWFRYRAGVNSVA